MKVVVVIPTYNEKDNIVTLIREIKKVLGNVKKWQWEILIVDDNSPDGTGTLVAKIAKKDKSIRLLSKTKKFGLGAAYLAGMKDAFEQALADVVIVMDADLSHNPVYIPEFLRKVEKGADFVVGSRYISGGSIPTEWSLHRKFLSVLGNAIVPLMLNTNAVKDWTSGYRAIRKKVYLKVAPKIESDEKNKGYTFNISFAYHTISSGFKVDQVPIKFIDRTNGKSKLGLEYLINTPLFLFRTRLRRLLQVL